jgi:imidazolonepropionase-like amidohydrolase
MRTPLLPSLLLLAALPAAAQAPAAAPATPPAPKSTVLRAARLLDVRTGRYVTPGVVVVTDGKIAATGEKAAVPPGAQVLELGDATLLPGFMDAHTHITGEPGHDWREDLVHELERTVPEKTLDAAVLARRTLQAGFTTVRNLGAAEYIDIGLRNAVNRQVADGPRILTATAGLGSTGGHCDNNGYARGTFAKEKGEGVADSPDAFRTKVREAIKYGADVIKVCATGGVLSKNADVDSPQLTQAELDAIVDEAHARKKKVAAHAHGDEGARRAVQAGIDSIEHGTFISDKTFALMKSKGTYYVPTLMAYEGIRERLAKNQFPAEVKPKVVAALEKREESMKRALKLGVPVAFGTDAGVYSHGKNAGEFRLLVAMGMKPADALRAGTLTTAELFGVQERLGTLEAGKLADVVAVPGDVLQDVRRTEQVFFVMKEGVVYRNDRAAPAVPAAAAAASGK